MLDILSHDERLRGKEMKNIEYGVALCTIRSTILSACESLGVKYRITSHACGFYLRVGQPVGWAGVRQLCVNQVLCRFWGDFGCDHS